MADRILATGYFTGNGQKLLQASGVDVHQAGLMERWRTLIILPAGASVPAAVGSGTVSFGGGTLKLQYYVAAWDLWRDLGTDYSWTAAPTEPVTWQALADDWRLDLSGATNPKLPFAFR